MHMGTTLGYSSTYFGDKVLDQHLNAYYAVQVIVGRKPAALCTIRDARGGKRLRHPCFLKGGFRHVCCSADIPFTEEFISRSSAEQVREEILRCYDLIQKLGKGVVYLGSSRVKPDHPHFLQAMELGKEVALLLDCATWTGVGPGLMDAVVKGAMSVEKPVGGFKISRESGEWTTSYVHPYLENHVYRTCRFFSARKHGLVDAAVREFAADRTAFIALPGGIGTLDEIFEILTLMQLERLGSLYPVPFLLLNYDGFYTKLLEFLQACKMWGTIAEGEVEKLWVVCDNNMEALQYLANFYKIPENSQDFRRTTKPLG